MYFSSSYRRNKKPSFERILICRSEVSEFPGFLGHILAIFYDLNNIYIYFPNDKPVYFQHFRMSNELRAEIAGIECQFRVVDTGPLQNPK